MSGALVITSKITKFKMAEKERADQTQISKLDNKNIDKSKLFEGYSFDEGRISRLFKALDVNGDGRIDAKELSDGLKKLGHHFTADHAEVIFFKVVLIYVIRTSYSLILTVYFTNNPYVHYHVMLQLYLASLCHHSHD